MSGYDEQYEVEEDLFGHPYPELVRFVRDLGTTGTVLHLGCGQVSRPGPLC